MTTPRLPNPGSDDGTWGDILNNFLDVSHNSDGTLQGSAVAAAGAELSSHKGQASGYAPLNGSSQVPVANLPVGATSSTVAAGNDSRITGALQASSNLSDVVSAGSARTNLGLGTAATHNVGDFVSSTTVALGNISGTITCNLSQGNVFTGTLTGNVTVSFTNWPTGEAEPTLILTQDSTGGRSITVSGITWLPTGAAPNNFATAAGATTIISLLSPDGGTTIYGDTGPQSGTSAGTFAAGNDSRITGALQATNSLSDVGSASAARTNLGLGTAATAAASSFVDTSTTQSSIAGSKTFTSVMGVTPVVSGAGLSVTDATNGGEIRVGVDSTHYLQLKKNNGISSQIRNVEVSGTSTIYLDPITDTTSASDVRLFRNVNTSSTTTALYLFAADGTSNTVHYLSVKASGSYLNATGGTLTVGASTGASGTFTVVGSQAVKRTTVADAAYNATATDYLIAYTSLTTGRTVTLPTAASITGRIYVIIDETGTANTNNITIATTSSQTINGTTTKVINTAYGSLKVYSNGANWIITP